MDLLSAPRLKIRPQACCANTVHDVPGLGTVPEAIPPTAALRTFEPAPPAHREGFLHHRWNGTCYPPFIDPAATAQLCRGWDTEAHDVLIVSHQKAGTHLAKRFLVELIRSGLNLSVDHPLVDGDIGHAAVPWPEVLRSQAGYAGWHRFLARTASAVRLWYSHCTLEDLPCRRIHPETRFVLVIREPRAVAVSQFHFWRRHPLLGVDPTLSLERFSELFAAGDLYFGAYGKHVLGWLRSASRIDPARLCVLRYEDMVRHKRATVARLQAFLFPGVELPAARVEAIAAATEFQVMKQELTARPRSFHFDPTVYFRAGTCDDWRQHLSASAAERVLASCRAHWQGQERQPWLEDYLDATAPA